MGVSAGGPQTPADAVVLACGGFQGNAEMMRRHFGPGGDTMRLISPGTRHNTGGGIRMALAIGADRAGDWNGMHAEPLDARDEKSAPVVLVYPYGIVVDRAGRRFFDEGAGLVHETWEWFAREIHFKTEGATAYAILDSRLWQITDYGRAIRSDVPPARADDVASLARQIGIDAANLAKTVADYNAACTGDPSRFDATCCDGLAAEAGLTPPKSNWARALDAPPYLAWPLVGAVAYTFGGLATDVRARVLRAGAPIPGLYAAGEITGHFHATAPNSVSVLRALVFGRIAGREAVEASVELDRQVRVVSSNSSSTVSRRQQLLAPAEVDDDVEDRPAGFDAEPVRIERAAVRAGRPPPCSRAASGNTSRTTSGPLARQAFAHDDHVVDRHAAVALRPGARRRPVIGNEVLEPRVGQLVADHRRIDLAVEQHLREAPCRRARA